jgi:hypothetical protein
MMPRRPIYQQKTQITATNFADASGCGADEARIPPALLELAGVGAARGLLKILAAKEWSACCIGNVAKLDCMFLPQTL